VVGLDGDAGGKAKAMGRRRAEQLERYEARRRVAGGRAEVAAAGPAGRRGTEPAPARVPGTEGQAAGAPDSRRLATRVELARLGTGGGRAPPRAPDGKKTAQGRLDGLGVQRRGL
jgi:hypothetical protein